MHALSSFSAALSAALVLSPAAEAAPPSTPPAPPRGAALAPLPSSSSPADSAAPSRPDGRRAGLALRTDGWDEGDGRGLRLALENTLGVALSEPKADQDKELATVVVRRRANGNVTIVFVRPDGREVERTLDLPADRAIATETIALAAGNLVRDEAAELVAALTPPPSTPVPAPAEAPPAAETVPSPPLPTTRRVSCSDGEPLFVGVDFAPYAGSSSTYADRRRTLSFNFIAGYTRGLNGFELGVGANIETAFMCGVQMAAGANVVLGDVHGVQLASANVALGNMQGAQLSVANFTKGDVEGVQVGTVGVAGGALVGAQLGVVNLLGKSALGNQSGVVNVAGGEVDGAQLGVVNLAGSATKGAQIGVVNLAGKNVDGAQIGVTNIANGDVRGTQIGVVNYADVSDYPVGVVSVVRHGRTSVDGWATETGTGMVGVRHGGRVIHNVYGVGYREGAIRAWTFALGLGARVPLATRLHVDFELMAQWLQRSQPFSDDAQIGSLGASFGYALTPVFGVFAAPTFNLLVTPDKELANIAPPWGAWDFYEGTSVNMRAWPGATLGVRASL